MRTPSIVRLVSAMLVASTILRCPAGAAAMAASCSASGRLPCNTCTAARCVASSGSPCSRSATRRCSPMPGRNTSTSPSSRVRASRTVRAASASGRSSARGGRYSVSTGKMRPSLRTTGTGASAPPSRRATSPPSSVADMTSTRSAGRKCCCVSSVRANPRSACSDRSWNSSNSTAPYGSSDWSSASSRVSTPSVTTSTRVRGDTRVSPRTR